MQYIWVDVMSLQYNTIKTIIKFYINVENSIIKGSYDMVIINGIIKQVLRHIQAVVSAVN